MKNPTEKSLKKKDMPRGRPGHRPKNTANTVSELRFRIVCMFFIFFIVSICTFNGIHMSRSPTDIIIEQGLHPNPGPNSSIRRLHRKTKPEDARRSAEEASDREKKTEEKMKKWCHGIPPISLKEKGRAAKVREPFLKGVR